MTLILPKILLATDETRYTKKKISGTISFINSVPFNIDVFQKNKGKNNVSRS